MSVPVITVAQMREWEKATWAAKRTPAEVISRVGHIVTTCARQLTRAGDAILILAGKGHNGDDARKVVQNLTDREVTLLNVLDPETGLKEFTSLLSLPPALIVEGLFGIGLRGTLDGPWGKLIDRINRARVPILSVDVPAGLNADTGEPLGAAVRATFTLTLGAPKRGLLAASALPYVGRLLVAPNIGLLPCPHTSDLLWTLPEDFAEFPPTRPFEAHKGSFGHLAIAAGSLGYHGAAVLATRAALRAQPGLVTTVVPENIYAVVAGQLQAAMVRPWSLGLPEAATAVLFGPGLAHPDLPTEIKTALARLWKDAPVPVIADATGLDWIPPGRVHSKAARVITPHAGEAGRLLDTPAGEIQADRPSAVRELSRRFGQCWVVLKGHQTIVGNAKGELYINCSGNPALAQGGSGDVLAGFLAGLLAQPSLAGNPLLTLRYAVWQHGATADRFCGERSNWTVEDLLVHLGDRKAVPIPACGLG
jgi:ADP-dependent NAD(P)H-hydrate dehydratase / NAD(P)H-hydrate epimerase